MSSSSSSTSATVFGSSSVSGVSSSTSATVTGSSSVSGVGKGTSVAGSRAGNGLDAQARAAIRALLVAFQVGAGTSIRLGLMNEPCAAAVAALLGAVRGADDSVSQASKDPREGVEGAPPVEARVAEKTTASSSREKAPHRRPVVRISRPNASLERDSSNSICRSRARDSSCALSRPPSAATRNLHPVQRVQT